MKVLLIGATGTIGNAVSQLFRKQAFTVISASRSTQPAVDFTDLTSIDAFFEKTGELDGIVITAGDAAFSPLDQLTNSHIELTLASKLMGQINLIRRGISRLRPNGVIVLTGGMLAYTPWPGTSMVAMVNAGLEGFVRAAALDMTQGRRLMIVHPPLVAETASTFGLDATPYPTAATVARTYLEAVQNGQNGTVIFVEGFGPANNLSFKSSNTDSSERITLNQTNDLILNNHL